MNGEHPRILIVDDEAPNVRALCDTLTTQGFEPVGCTTGAQALEELRRGEFDLVLTDLMMPGMDGIELLKAASAIDPNLVGVMMTGQGTIETAVEAMRAGALDYILKPLKLSSALPVLHRSLNVRRLRVENAALRRREQEQTEDLRQRNEDLEAFAAAVSHDLRSPLRAVSGCSRILREDFASQLPEEAADLLDRIQAGVLRMDQLIDDLLLLARVNEAELRFGTVNLSLLAESALDELRSQEGERSVEALVEPDLVASGDERLMGIAIGNLLSNAWKFSSHNPAPRIHFGRQEAQGRNQFFVRDNGAGFPPESVDKLFRPFERLHTQTEFPGTGIGLTTVRRIIHRHGGRVWAAGALDQGATFYFELS